MPSVTDIGMLSRAEMADQLYKAKDEITTKAEQDETDLKAKKSALLDAIKKYVYTSFLSYTILNQLVQFTSTLLKLLETMVLPK